MSEVVFSIKSWSAWSTSKTQPSNWVDWANQRDFQATTSLPDVSMLPPMKRRRMSSLTKMALSTALDCLKETDTQPNCIFASQHGELTRTVNILNRIAAGEEVSPTDFSLSVHNTALGHFSILTNNKQPATTVAAGEDTFGYALLEAGILLSRFPAVPVLVVFFDEPLPEPLSIFNSNSEDLCIALLLTSGTDEKISLNFLCNNDIATPRENTGTEFLKFYLSDHNSGEVITSRMSWHWNKLV